MPTALDLQIRPVATELIEEFGRTFVVRRVSSEYDPQQDEIVTTTSDVTTKGVIEGYDARFVTGTLIQVGDLQITVPGEAFESSPMSADLVFADSTDGVRYTVVSVEPVFSGEQVAIYILQVRGEPEGD